MGKRAVGELKKIDRTDNRQKGKVQSKGEIKKKEEEIKTRRGPADGGHEM